MISANIPNATRRAVYARDGFRCAICDDSRALQIHHYCRRSECGNDSLHNLITLCWRCHAIAHGTRLPEFPDYMDAAEMEQACAEYLSDLYLDEWWPYK